MSGGKKEHCHVWVRTKPTTNFSDEVLQISPDLKGVKLHVEKDPKAGLINSQNTDWSFKFDGVLHGASQEDVFSKTTLSLVNDALTGYNSTILVHGQCGSGKSYTILGGLNRFETRGLVPRALTHLFSEVNRRIDTNFSISVSYYEIYNNFIYDLLGTRNAIQLSTAGLKDSHPLPPEVGGTSGVPLIVAENEDGSIYVQGLSRYRVTDEEHALSLMFEGEANRAVVAAPYGLSSRSHAVFTIHIDSHSNVHSNARVTSSQLTFVDLSGLERFEKGVDSDTGLRSVEGVLSNGSLTFLEQAVISLARRNNRKRAPPLPASKDPVASLSRKAGSSASTESETSAADDYVPFRQSTLTHCLKPALSLRNKTLLIATLWPEARNLKLMVSSLRFASIVRQLSGVPVMNESYDPEVKIRELRGEISALKRELGMHDTLTNRHQISYEPLSEQQKFDIRKQVRQYLRAEIDQIDIINVRQLEGVFQAFKQLYSQLETEVEERIRAKQSEQLEAQTRVVSAGDKQMAAISGSGTEIDLASIGPSSKTNASLVGTSGGVGKTEGTSFSVGQAPSSKEAKLPGDLGVLGVKRKEAATKQAEREREKERAKASSAAEKSTPRSGVASGIGDSATDRRISGDAPDSGLLGMAKSGEPPKKSEAFEEFKRDTGSEIHRVFLENKGVEQKNRQAYVDLSRQLNSLKNEIDETRRAISQLHSLQEQTIEVIDAPTNGPRVITEEEHAALKKLQQLKEQYRATLEDMEAAKAQLHYCERQVQLTRQKLIEEFEKWYYRTYVDAAAQEVAGSGVKIPSFYVAAPLEDDHEKQERLQKAALLEQFGLESVPFQFAKSRVDKMKFYQRAMSQPQPAWHKETRHQRAPSPESGVSLLPSLREPRTKETMLFYEHLLKY